MPVGAAFANAVHNARDVRELPITLDRVLAGGETGASTGHSRRSWARHLQTAQRPLARPAGSAEDTGYMAIPPAPGSVLTFGEVLLKLWLPPGDRLDTTAALYAECAGADLNVAAAVTTTRLLPTLTA